MHTYDIGAHPLVAQLAASVGAEASELADLHRATDVRRWLDRENPRRLGLNPIDQRFKAAGGGRQNAALQACYVRFLQEVVAPLVPDAEGLLYQREPNLRCHLPGTGRSLVLRHCDADYHHQPNELNFWLPCTDAYASNALWVEV